MQREEAFISFAASCLPLSAILQIEWNNVAVPPQTFKFTPRRRGQSILEVSMMALGDIWWVEQKVSNGVGTTSATWTKGIHEHHKLLEACLAQGSSEVQHLANEAL